MACPVGGCSSAARRRTTGRPSGRAAVGTLGASLDEGLTLDEILSRGERVLAEERQAAAEERMAAGGRLDGDCKALWPTKPLTDEEFLISEGYGHLVRAAKDGVAVGGEGAAACPETSVWLWIPEPSSARGGEVRAASPPPVLQAARSSGCSGPAWSGSAPRCFGPRSSIRRVRGSLRRAAPQAR